MSLQQGRPRMYVAVALLHMSNSTSSLRRSILDTVVLQKLATHTLQLIQPLSMNDSGGITRQDTLDDIHIDDAFLNPSSPEFDLNKWIPYEDARARSRRH